MPITRILSVAAAIFMIDRIVKIWVVEWLELRNIYTIDVWPPYLNLRMAWNEGINFGLFGSGSDVTKWILVSVALLISLVLLVAFRKARGFWLQLSVGLVVGGALGNVFDRLTYGAVADFLNMSCCGIDNPYAFNVADISIFFGVVGLVLLDGKKSRKKRKR